MSSWFKELRYAVRVLIRSPGFTVVAVGTLALGIGANSAIFSVVRAVLVAPLPYDEPDELVIVWGELRNREITHFPHSPPDFRDMQESGVFAELGAFFSFGQSLTGDGQAEQVDVGIITSNFLSLLGVSPAVGRGLTRADDTPFNPTSNTGAPPPTTAIILSHGYWQRRFGGASDVIGRSISIGGGPAEIVGVMPPDFELLLPPTVRAETEVDIWAPARLDPENAPRNNVFLTLVGRLAPGVTIEQAQAGLDALAARAREQSSTWETAGYHLRVEPLHEDVTRHVRPTVLALLGAVGFVLLIACANVANLLLVRATARSREMAIRVALGGGRMRLVGQVFAESLILALLGCAFGLGLAHVGIRALVALRPADLPRLETISIDPTVLGFALLASIISAGIFGIAPALGAFNDRVTDELRGRTQSAGGTWQRHARNAMVVMEVALSLVLLVGTGLMVRSFAALTRMDPGFNAENVLTFNVALPFFEYPNAAQRAAFHTQLHERLSALPGVTSVGGAFPLPLGGQAANGRYGTESALEDERNFLQADYRGVMPGYFDAMGTPLIEGRVFTFADYADSLPNVLVDELLARKTWPGESAVGKRILIRLGPEAEWVNVIGVVQHQRHQSLASEGPETVFFTDRFFGSFGQTWVVRTSTDPTSMTHAVRTEVAALNPNVPVDDARLMEDFLVEARSSTRFSLVLITVFSACAVILAVVGLYGVLSFVVRQRTEEIGIRMAFGAPRGKILKLVVGQGMTLTMVGMGIGLLMAVGLTRLMASMLVGTAPTDPVTFVAISLLFGAVALVASLLPALRATQVDPVVALREE